jgi:hypothetical protein
MHECSFLLLAIDELYGSADNQMLPILISCRNQCWQIDVVHSSLVEIYVGKWYLD